MESRTRSQIFSHVAIGVADIERSTRFYVDGLDFKAGTVSTVAKQVAKAVEIDADMVLQNIFLRRKDILLELLQFVVPPHTGSSERRPMTQLGVTHISFGVNEDLDIWAARIEGAGGHVLRDTRVKYGLPRTADGEDYSTELLFCTDPDGVRIELMRLSPAWWAKLHPAEPAEPAEV
jgi:catechol 2,3-dioxygenase-like lactoylglutathione lyase family enzyme